MTTAKLPNHRIRRWAIRAAAFVLPLAALFFAARAPRALAGDCCGGGKPEDAKAGETAKSESAGLLVDLGNSKCPVMGGKPNGKVFSEWNGLRVGHCCGMCTSKFAANPEQYLKQSGADWKAALAAVKKVNEAKGADRAKALGDLKKHWTVVREPAAEPEAAGLLVDLGNSKCPVMGGKVDGKSFSEWNGLRVGHCCPGCGAKFRADPEKLLADAKVEWKPIADAMKAVDAARGADRAKALEALKKKYRVLRDPPAEGAK